ncbi:MAG: GIY-YIG nuclease family protein [Holosporales bacterium]
MSFPRRRESIVDLAFMVMKNYWVYILASGKNGTLYVGVTNDISRRIFEHKKKLTHGFTKKYNVNQLVYIEEFEDIHEAIHREKCIKRWNRAWKLRLIQEQNPSWIDLGDHFT